MRADKNRRNFLKQSSVAVALMAFPNIVSALSKPKPKLSFSTLGCPKWNFKEIVEFANKHNYKGIEFRGIAGELDLTKCAAFSKSNIKDSLKLIEDNQLEIVGLGSSAKLHVKEEKERQKNLNEAKRFIDLAQELNCKAVRVFPDKLPKEISKEETMGLISKGLIELSEFADRSKVNVLLETHGDLVKTDDILQVIQNINRNNVGLIWDILNMWVKTKEEPSYVYSKLKPYIRHVHLKDAIIDNGKSRYVLFGEGEAPNKKAISLLNRSGYNGYYSFESEKMWHPEIEEPEIAFPHFIKAVKKYF